jgi:Fe-coproporphyrin III synthase
MCASETRAELEEIAGTAASTGDTGTLSTLPILIIHAHSSCNCRCVMCDIWKNKQQRTFGLRDLLPQLESIRRLGVRWIVFSGGEPLMNPALPEMCSTLRAEGIRLTLLTTGLLLEKYAGSVATSFDDVIVSLDGPAAIHDKIRRVDGAFALLQSGVHALRANRSDIRITARTTIQKMNHLYLMDTCRTAKSFRLNQISFLAVDLTSAAFNRALVWPVGRQSEVGLSLSDLPQLESEIENLIAHGHLEFGTDFLAESPAKLRRIASHFRAHLGLEPPQSPMCNAPWVSAVVEADGSVRPCFFHRTIGNLHGTQLDGVVNGPQARMFREGLNVSDNSTCRNCVCSLNYRA